MNKHEKEVMKHTVEQEKAIISELKKIYRESLDEIGEKIKVLMSDELTQSKIYRIEYQKALRGQVAAILDTLNSRQYSSIQEYLKSCYEEGFIGTLYYLNRSGIPLILPLDPQQAVDAVMLDSKISEGMYSKLGHNIKVLKKNISLEISRGLSTAMSYTDIARNLQNRSNITLNQTLNIVQTEGHRIQNRSALDSAERAKEKGTDLVKVWDSTLDGKTRPHHRQLDGQVRELDEDFEVDGMKADSPGHFGKPSEDCRCRCAVLIKPRWDVDSKFTKRDNETKELLEFENVKSYEEFKKKYWATADKSIKKVKSTVINSKINKTRDINPTKPNKLDKMRAELEESKKKTQEAKENLAQMYVNKQNISYEEAVAKANSIEDKARYKFYTKTELDKMPISKLRAETNNLAKKYYSSGRSGISFGGADTHTVADKLTENASRTSLTKDYMSLKKAVASIDNSSGSGIINYGITYRATASGKVIATRSIEGDYEILLPDGSNSIIKNPTFDKYEVFAGKGSEKELRVKEHLVNNYGGDAENWFHAKGYANIADKDGVTKKANIHWFEEETVGIRELFVKGWSKK